VIMAITTSMIVFGLVTVGATAATTTLTERAVASLLDGEWGGTPDENSMIEQKVKQRAVLGSPDHMKRTDYAASPILKRLKECALPSVVNVAYVPALMGKTTACHAVMNMYVREGTNHGLCFSPNDNSRPYLEHMVTLLGFTDTENPPAGLLRGLLRALAIPFDAEQPSFLILDDFMPDGPTNIDIDLLVAIKTLIRSMNIVVVVLTSSKASADYMLTMNTLGTIVPLVERAALRIIRADFQKGNFKRRDESFHLDWETYLSMEWDSGEMKKAILVHPSYKEKSAQQKKDVDAQIDTVLQQFTNEERKRVSPPQVLQELHSIQPIQTLNSSKSATFPQSAMHQETGVYCGGCHVL
jgi:hypothetical protein